MQDGDSTKERTKRNGEQFGQAHLIPKTKSTYLQSATINHARIQRQEQKQERNAELQPNIIVTRAHLHSSTLQDWRHTQTFTQNPKETKVATSLARTESFSVPSAPSSSGVVGELVLHAARVGRSTPRTGFEERTGFPALSRRTLKQELPLSLTTPSCTKGSRSREPSSSALFVARGSAPSLRPVLCSTPHRGVSRKVSSGGVPPP